MVRKLATHQHSSAKTVATASVSSASEEEDSEESDPEVPSDDGAGVSFDSATTTPAKTAPIDDKAMAATLLAMYKSFMPKNA